MSAAAATAAAPGGKHFRWKRWLLFALVIVVIGAAANLLGWNIRGWFKDLWDTMTSIPLGYLLAAFVLKTVQTTAVAFAYYSILRFAYPGKIRWLQIWAAYAAAVALNNILPASLGTLVLLIMFTQFIPDMTFAGSLAVYGVQKIFFMLIGTFTYLYLFLSVSGSFDIKFSFVHTHPWATAVLLIGGVVLIYLLARRLWPRILNWWEDAKESGQILAHPRKYMLLVFLPELISWLAMLGVMAVFLAAYDIPVTFDTLMRLCGGNSIASLFSVTPGGAGVNQAFNVASLNGITSPQNAAAYSAAQQLVTTAWNLLFAIVLMTLAFGWSGSKSLVGESYAEAKQKQAEQKAAHKAKKEAKRAAKAAGDSGPAA